MITWTFLCDKCFVTCVLYIYVYVLYVNREPDTKQQGTRLETMRSRVTSNRFWALGREPLAGWAFGPWTPTRNPLRVHHLELDYKYTTPSYLLPLCWTLEHTHTSIFSPTRTLAHKHISKTLGSTRLTQETLGFGLWIGTHTHITNRLVFLWLIFVVFVLEWMYA